jgi:hypothetical protein
MSIQEGELDIFVLSIWIHFKEHEVRFNFITTLIIYWPIPEYPIDYSRISYSGIGFFEMGYSGIGFAAAE